MTKELKLKYFIELVSNLREKAGSDAKALVQAQEKIQKALGDTEQKLGRYERVLGRIGGMHNASLERQAQYFSQIALSAGRAEAAVAKYAQKLATAGKVGAAGVAAFQAGKAVVAAPLAQERSYERQLADTANVAFVGKDLNGKRAGMVSLDKAVKAALRGGGGKREDALGALNDMIASGVVTNEQATTALPTIMKYSTAGNAEPSVIANLATKLLQSGFKVEQLPVLLDKALVAGQAGGFELKDMAKWLPQLIATGDQAGLMGMHGYEKILAAAQASVITAGTKDEAGTNLKDLLSHLSSHALKTSAKRMGVDAVGMLTTAMGKGEDSLSGVVALSDYIISKDPRAAAMQKKLDGSATKRDAQGKPVYSEEQQSIMQQQAKLLEGSAIGNLFHNQQSLLALVALRNNRKYVEDVMQQVGGAKGQFGQDNYALVAGTNEFKQQQKDNEKLFAQTNAVEGVNNALGNFSQGMTDLYQKYPGFGEVLEGTKLAVGGLGAAALGAGTVLALLGGAGAMGMAGKAAGWLAGLFTAQKLGGAAATGLSVGGMAGAGAGAAGVFAGYELWQLGSAMSQLDGAKNREGVKLSPYAKGRLDAIQNPNGGPGVPGLTSLDYLTLSYPGAVTSQLEAGKNTEIKVGEGTLLVDVRVTNDGVTATPSVLRPLSLVRIDAGATNPGGFRK